LLKISKQETTLRCLPQGLVFVDFKKCHNDNAEIAANQYTDRHSQPKHKAPFRFKQRFLSIPLTGKGYNRPKAFWYTICFFVAIV
jgi:hypothetical protein